MRIIKKILLFLLLSSSLSTSCQVPVFRYALERWQSDDYLLYLVTPKPLTTAQQETLLKFNDQLQHANLQLNTIDASRVTEAELWQHPDIDVTVQSPQLALFLPSSLNNKSPILTLPFTPENLATLIDSPARRAIVESTISGSSSTWIILHNSQPIEAKKIQSTLNGYLDKIEQKITIPDGIVGTTERHKINESTDLEDVLRSSIPLKISFTSQLIDRNSPAEQAFIKTLLATSSPSVKNSKDTLIIPIFGRGRYLPPMPASHLSYPAILAGCEYLCGACSCQVKEQNPGFDLIIKENWKSHLTTNLAVIDKSLPPLEGVAEIITTPTPTPLSTSTTSKLTDVSVTRFIPIIAIVLCLLAVIATFVILRKK